MRAEPAPATRRAQILEAAIPVVGQFGLRKTSVEDLARAAGLSKQGLYLHFSTKEELLLAAMQRYFDEGLRLTREALQADAPLPERLVAALDAWFGRHLAHFNPASLEVLEPGRAAAQGVDRVKRAYVKLLERAIAASPEYAQSGHASTPAELARVLFQFGLTWKEGFPSRAAFRETVRLCVRACFPPRGAGERRPRGRSP